jgi:hypothetical protein
MDIRTLLISLMTLVVLGIVLLVIFEFTRGTGVAGALGIGPYKTSVTLIDQLQDGRQFGEIDNTIPLSYNETEGLEYTYSAWILVNDYAPSTANPIIFVKGNVDLTQKSPAVYLQTGKNEIVIEQDTYDKKGIKVVVTNAPANKFIHLAIVVNQTSFDVYVNGLIYHHSTLRALPLQNTSPIFVSANGGWNGQIGSFVYYNYALSSSDIQGLASKKPVENPAAMPYYSHYLSPGWWVGSA